jgi:TPR repeat protein
VSGNIGKCPFCNSDRASKTDEDEVEQLMKRVEANDANSMFALGTYYDQGSVGLQQDKERTKELWTQASKLGSSQAHYHLAVDYDGGGDTKKAKFHYETATMAGHETARYNLGYMEFDSGNVEQAVKHWMIAASAGNHKAMRALITCLEIGHVGYVSRASIDSTLTAYNSSCTEMRSKARDAFIQFKMRRIERNNA